MDNVSHSLAGWALSRAVGPRRPPGTTLALVLASNLPDIDIVLEARSDAAYLLFHRGLTHSLVGLVILPLVLAAGLWWAYGGRTRFDWLALVCACGVALHLLYDVVTPWGTMLL
ncbi:MAG TPA: metal-dependent hydrolase, partial [Gemmatimonadota bacterium]|nr:metal-dependent hydrolase [Gemmatimonadota bacterium]